MHTIARALALVLLAARAGAFAVPGTESEAKARLAQELERAERAVAALPAGDPIGAQVKDDGRRGLALAREALRADQFGLALLRAAPVLVNLAGAEYVQSIPLARRDDEAAFEAERTRMGAVLADALGDAKDGELATLRPAAVRALAQVASLQVRELYDASLDYGRATEPRIGLFYVGQAKGARDFVALCRELAYGPPAAPADAPPRPLAADVDRLEDELLAAYFPPRSLLLHGEFIAASALLKEARELDAAGLRDGALLRLMQAALQSANLRPRTRALDAAGVARELRELGERVAKRGGDGSLARLFLDSGEAAVATDVVPRWFAALEPVAPAAAGPPPRATVTLVRWPYT